MAKTTDKLDAEKAREQIATGEAQALDVRSEDTWRDSHIPGAQHADEDSIEETAAELDSDVPVVLVADGDPPEAIVSTLSDKGFDVAVLDGGMKAWKKADFTVQPSDDFDESADPEEGATPEAESAGDQPAS
jgi:rhodanese-related sulfurtransferase